MSNAHVDLIFIILIVLETNKPCGNGWDQEDDERCKKTCPASPEDPNNPSMCYCTAIGCPPDKPDCNHCGCRCRVENPGSVTKTILSPFIHVLLLVNCFLPKRSYYKPSF